jgi:hypothetical protein
MITQRIHIDFEHDQDAQAFSTVLTNEFDLELVMIAPRALEAQRDTEDETPITLAQLNDLGSAEGLLKGPMHPHYQLFVKRGDQVWDPPPETEETKAAMAKAAEQVKKDEAALSEQIEASAQGIEPVEDTEAAPANPKPKRAPAKKRG